MHWGISFQIPAVYESDLVNLPPPSEVVRMNGRNKNKILTVFYHFLFNPQSWQEWQRVAAIKKQIKDRLKKVWFVEYERNDATGKFYAISELGKHFPAFVKFPKQEFPYSKRGAYKMLCRHSKRLHYEGLLFEEQLISTSFRFNQTKAKEGFTQTMKRALSAYRFALRHKDKWPVKLSKERLHQVLSEAAMKSAEVKRSNSQTNRDRAKILKEEGYTMQKIADEIGVSKRTVFRWQG